MAFQDFQIILLLVFSALLSLGIAYYAWRRKDVPANTTVAGLMVSVAWWSFFYALELTAESLEFKVWWARVEYLAIVAVPLLWFRLVLHRTGRAQSLATSRKVLLAVVPVITLVMVWTSDFHTLYWSRVELSESGPLTVFTPEYGPWFWVYIVYAYVLLLSGGVMLAASATRLFRTLRLQSVLLLLAVFAPLLGNALYITGASPIPALDLTPFGFTLTGVFIVWALFGFRLLDLVPMARAGVFEDMPDGIIVIDRHRRIVDVNPTGRRILESIGQPLLGQAVPPRIAGMLDLLKSENPKGVVAKGHSFTIGQESRLFDVSVSPIEIGRQTAGAVLVFRDVTQRELAEVALRVTNQALEDTNVQLRDEITQRQAAEVALARSEALRRLQVAAEAKEQERKRLAEELHDQTLAQLSSIIVELGFLAKQSQTGGNGNTNSAIIQHLDDLRARVRTTEEGLRQIVQGIYPAVLTNLGLVPALRAYFEQLTVQPVNNPTAIKIELVSSGLDSERLPE